MKASHVIGIVLLSVVTSAVMSFITIRNFAPQTEQFSDQKTENLYQRVLRAGRLRCAYCTYPPLFVKDPNTGKFSGIFFEAVEAAGKNLGLRIDWTEEVGTGSMIEGLQTGRYDVVASGIWNNSARGKVVDFSMPLYYSAVCAYVRQNETRFSKNVDAINSPNVRIATMDGTTEDYLARNRFPLAQRFSLPELSDWSQTLLNVATNKADVTFSEAQIAYQFIQHNPGTLKNITATCPLLMFGNSIMFKKGESEFKSMIDTALAELSNSGYIDQLLDKYEPIPGVFYRLNYPYRKATK